MSLADAIGWAGTACVSVAFCLLVAGLVRSEPGRVHVANGLYAAGSWLGFLANVLEGSPKWAVLHGLLAAWFTWLWWKNRRKGRGRKALKELGDKSRRRVRALADQMTPSPIPSPGGAG